MIRFVIAFLALFICNATMGQENYAVSAIPKALLTRASAVIRNDELTIQVNGLDDVTRHRKTAVTILNSAGDDESQIVLFYDKNNQIKSLKGIIYNEFGLPAGKFGEKDFKDMSAVSDGTLYQDDRVKVFEPAQTTYPYTVVYEYEIKSKQSLFFPRWKPVTSTGVSIEKSSLRFICPPDFTLRHQEINYPGKPDESTGKDTRIFTWQVKDVQAIRSEPFSPDPERFMTSVKLAPESFAYRGLKGRFSNWTEYGKWMYENLLREREALPETTKLFINELVKDIPDPKAKAKKIYTYMQDKTRYISVQIGIGGFQPYPAADVDRLSYGDCKGLVNYTRALLKAVNIESYYCIVNSGSFKKDVSTDFASINDGDHIILCLPFKNDTTWLECTNKRIPFGFLGDFTDDRLVLACTPDGGKLLRTPKFTYSDNRQTRKASFSLEENGNLKGSITTRFEGTQYDNHDILEEEPFKEQVKHLAKLYSIPNFDIHSLEFKKEKDVKPVTIENINFSSREYASLSNGRMYLSMNVLNKEDHTIPDIRNRTNLVYINRGFLDEDEYIFEIPAKLKAEHIPGNTVIEKPFGKYSAVISIKGNVITYHRTLQFNEGTYPKEQYSDLAKFYQDIVEADNSRLVLKL
ncbi:transglutaminase-like putative cysteine protease [Arcticibacter tournemirensis]|uniref:DUF3857 domain-containing protein n=1 Tax=Arcticibacter tournemirensis TaxID=699437 RepID=A0A5M9GTE6_9SPHI|nr:DUF3857 domain-containing protein [Arcticibacter tournemirensis]KAA8477149.1 DUF3857 domain-containing protein [Arcticibacter tournemirensis]TQM51205.1 transglutaminase-like putative cysteine protease [Arcticibacter tournemirensis]